MLLIHFFIQFISKQNGTSVGTSPSFKIISTILMSGAEEKFDI